MNKHQHNSGFTLIETIIYIALFAIVFGGGLLATYQILQGGVSMNSNLAVQEDGNFLLRKIDWALSGWVSPVAVSISGSGTSSKLVVAKPGVGQLTLDSSCGAQNLCLTRPSAGALPLNSSEILISNIQFTRVGGGASPDGIQASFTAHLVNNTTTYQFSTTKYLRK